MFRYTWRTFSRELTLIVFAAIFFVPIYIFVTLSLKSSEEVYTQPLTFPTDLHIDNYSTAWEGSGTVSVGRAMLNSLLISVGSVGCLIALGSVCAYTLARRPSRLSTGIYLMFLLAIIVPFQLGVVPVFVVMRELHLTGNHVGMIILNTGLLMPLTVFLYTGFVRAMPTEYEEAARVDGAGLFRTFTRIIFPLLRPVTGTVAVLTGVITWNEFFLPLVFLGYTPNQTLPVAIYSFVGEFTSQWNLIFAAVVVAIAPVVVFFLFAQRQLMHGFSGGLRQ